MTLKSLPDIPNVCTGELVGNGGFGAVYRGFHRVLEIDVAIKIIADSGPLAGAMSLEQTLREAQFMARLDHPNLLRVFDAGRQENYLYFVLEFMDGGSLDKTHLLPVERAITTARQLLSGLQALHDARLLHRDIKPANCLLRTRDGRLKLADLGIAVELATHSERNYNTAGTIPFMAPELFENPPQYGVRSDLYALGMTLACLLLESAPYPIGTLPEMLAWAKAGARPQMVRARPDLPLAVTRLVERMISAAPQDRPASAAEALTTLNESNVSTISADPVKRIDPVSRYGAWVIGDQGLIYDSSNWRGYLVTHAETGAAGRLMQLQPHGPLAQAKATEMILECAERSARLNHPGIVPVLDWGVRENVAFIVTGQQGRSLNEMVRAAGPCSEIVALEFTIALAAALAHLHEQNLVYQIVDPGAAIITPDARAAQLGFSAFVVEAGTSAFSRALVPLYAAPEALSRVSDTIEPSADLYGLGTILYFLLVGHEAYEANPKPQTLMQVRAAAPAMTAPTAGVILDLLNPDPSLRPTAAIVNEELTRILQRLRGTHPSEKAKSSDKVFPPNKVK